MGLYVIQLENDTIKIGKEDETFASRMSAHQRRYGNFEILVFVPGPSYAIEQFIHRTFRKAGYLVEGESEVYHPFHEVRAFVDALRRDHGAFDNSVTSWGRPAGWTGRPIPALPPKHML